MSAITANPDQAWLNYLANSPIPRFFYFQPEPRVAALAIFSVIAPFLLASYRHRSTASALILIAASIAIATLTNSFTATGYTLLAVVFLFSERWAFIVACIFTAVITIGVPLFIGTLVYTGNIEAFFRTIMGPTAFGMANAGTLATTAVTLFVAINAFARNPIFGLGIGGYANYFYTTVPTMGVSLDSELLQKLTGTGLSSDYVPTAQSFVMKILSEQGLVGIAIMSLMLLELYRFSYRSKDNETDCIALRFVVAAIILSWQAYTSFLNPLYWVAAGLLGSIQRRRAIASMKFGSEQQGIATFNASS